MESLGEAVESANAELAAKPEKSTPAKTEPTARAEPSKAAEKAPAAEDDWPDRPKWVDQWKKPSREKMRALAELEGAGDLLPDVFKEIEDRYDYSGKQQAEFDKYRKRWDPYGQVIEPLEQRFQLQGVDPRAGLQQMVAVSDYLQRDPDQAMMWLAQQFKPRDVKAFVQNLAQQYGVDLGGIAQSQPWVDPAIEGRIKPLEEANRFLVEQRQREYQYQQQVAQNQIVGAIRAFRDTVDDQGNPKYPHYEQLENSMTAILSSGGAVLPDGRRSLELHDLYEAALWLNPKLREEAIKSRASQADHNAVQEAQRKTAEAQEAMKASRNVTGSKTAGKIKQAQDLDTILREEAKRLTG